MSSASKAPPSSRSRATNELVEVGKTVFYALLIALVVLYPYGPSRMVSVPA